MDVSVISAIRDTLAPGLTCKDNCKYPSLSSLNLIGLGTGFDCVCRMFLAMARAFFEDIGLSIPGGMATSSFEGSVLLFLNGPTEKLEFCLNGVFGKTAHKFEGFHSIPANLLHFVSYRLGGEGPFITLIFKMETDRVLAFEWSQDEELFKLKTEVVDCFDADKLLSYPGLIQYRRFMDQQEGAQAAWLQFTRLITKSSLERVFSQLKVSNCVYEVTPMIESHHSLLKEMLEHTKNTSSLNFTRIPTVKEFTRDPLLITKCAMDRTPIYDALKISFEELLSELQICFLLLTFAQNFEGFEQWLDIVSLLLQCFDLAKEHEKQYCKLLQVIEEQLELCPDDFFGGLMNENKLYKLISGFLRNSDGKFAPFCDFYTRKFGWTFDQGEDYEDPEDAPVIV